MFKSPERPSKPSDTEVRGYRRVLLEKAKQKRQEAAEKRPSRRSKSESESTKENETWQP